MWPRRSRRKCRIEIELKSRIQHQIAFQHARHVNLVIAFRVNFARAVFIQEVVCNYQAAVVMS